PDGGPEGSLPRPGHTGRPAPADCDDPIGEPGGTVANPPVQVPSRARHPAGAVLRRPDELAKGESIDGRWNGKPEAKEGVPGEEDLAELAFGAVAARFRPRPRHAAVDGSECNRDRLVDASPDGDDVTVARDD